MLHLKVSVRESVKNSFAVFKCHNAQIFADFFNENPLADSSIRLDFSSYRILKSQFTPLAFEIRTLAKDLLFKVARGLHW
jgi:hypothetical protein